MARTLLENANDNTCFGCGPENPMGLRLQFFQDCRGWSRPSSPSKLNTVEHVDRLDWMMEQLHGAGFSRLNATQLFHNRQELFVHAQR